MKKSNKKRKVIIARNTFGTSGIQLCYGHTFLQMGVMRNRGNKSIYIRQEYHERLSRIVQIIGKDEIPLYAYLDNILAHHFELFEKAITADFNKNIKPIF